MTIETNAGNLKCYTCFSPVNFNGIGTPTLNEPTGEDIPQADYLVLTWTVAETCAFALVFGCGKYQILGMEENNNLYSYTDPTVSYTVEKEDGGCHGFWFPFRIGDKTCIGFKSNIHPKEKEQTAPMQAVIENLIKKVNPKYLVTSGTSGGVWPIMDIGDVVVGNSTRYGLSLVKEMDSSTFWQSDVDVTGSKPDGQYNTWYDYVNDTFLNNACTVNELKTGPQPRKNTANPQVFYQAPEGFTTTVITNISFTDEYKDLDTYRQFGAALEENDSFVVQACQTAGFNSWAVVRNISDLPQPTEDQSQSDDQYDIYGLCSSLNGAFGVWAFIMGH